jgi:Zn-dependent protease with chaperone function
MKASVTGVLLRLLLWLYYPFLLLLCLALVGCAILCVKVFLSAPLVLFLIPVIFLALAFLQIVWAARALFWRLPERDETEFRVARSHLEGLYQFVGQVAKQRGLTPPDVIRLTAYTVAYVYEDKKGRAVLVVGGLAIRAFSQPVLAGVIAHELMHFTAGDAHLLRRSRRRGLVMNVLERGIRTQPFPFMNPVLWILVTSLNPVFWLIYAYHFTFALLWSFNSRCQEFAADQQQVRQIGKKGAAAALLHVVITENLPWASSAALAEVAANDPLDQIFKEQARRAQTVDADEWRKACRKQLAKETGWFDSHPALKDRLRGMGVSPRQALDLSLDQSGPPSTELFADWDALENILSQDLVSAQLEYQLARQETAQIYRAVFR